MQASLLLVATLAGAVQTGHAASSVVSNSQPRVDVLSGEILDIHDGNTIRIGNQFFWYGAGYGSCTEMSSGCASVQVGSCGFNLNHTVQLATSPDLVHWTYQGVVLPVANRPYGIVFSPWVAYSPATKKYVMWFNVLPVVNGAGDFDQAYYAVATSDSPLGPFQTVKVNVTGIAYTKLPDAPSIFVDDDGSGYIAFTHEDTHINHVQALTPDLLGPLTPNGAVSAQIGYGNNEGILMFKRNGMYYIGFGACCCFCYGGTNLELFTSSSPLGPYVSVGNVTTASDWQAQSGAIWFTGIDWVMYGDRWQSAPDKIKAHDFSFMSPLVWNADGSAQHVYWADNVTIRY